MFEGKQLRERIERHKAEPSDDYWSAYYTNGYAYERIGAERIVKGTMYINNVVIAQSCYEKELELGGFRSHFIDTVRNKLNFEGFCDTFVEFEASYLTINGSSTASFVQRVEMPGHDFSHAIYLDEVAETFIDACEPLLVLIEQIETRFYTDSGRLCDRYFATDKDWEELGFV